jgi:sn-glycerol 3-phosphate transport system permease protein
MEKRTVFRGHGLPWLLLAPQLAITVVFFLWPASQALWQALFVEDAFGLGRRYVGMENLAALLHDDQYRNSLRVTAVFSLGVTALALGMALLLAGMADHVGRGAIVLAYRTLLIWPYAVAPAIAGMLWLFMFNPSVGIVAWLLGQAGTAGTTSSTAAGDAARVLAAPGSRSRTTSCSCWPGCSPCRRR